MIASVYEEDPRHAQFLDLCQLYGDFNRPVFLEAVHRCLVNSASAAELKSLRGAIRDRAQSLGRTGRKGRPPAEHNRKWIRGAAQLVWQKEILGWPWSRIAKEAGLKPSRANIRTFEQRRDRYAWSVFLALPPHAGRPEELKRLLDSQPVRRMLRSRLFLPLDTHPEESKRLVFRLLVEPPPRR